MIFSERELDHLRYVIGRPSVCRLSNVRAPYSDD